MTAPYSTRQSGCCACTSVCDRRTAFAVAHRVADGRSVAGVSRDRASPRRSDSAGAQRRSSLPDGRLPSVTTAVPERQLSTGPGPTSWSLLDPLSPPASCFRTSHGMIWARGYGQVLVRMDEEVQVTPGHSSKARDLHASVIPPRRRSDRAERSCCGSRARSACRDSATEARMGLRRGNAPGPPGDFRVPASRSPSPGGVSQAWVEPQTGVLWATGLGSGAVGGAALIGKAPNAGRSHRSGFLATRGGACVRWGHPGRGSGTLGS